ncbi:MAG: hypothetical protein MZV70_71825 [Desulfobacterales bacterium]|nr:hypothetical protein [Desulfobacterales bacterium]
MALAARNGMLIRSFSAFERVEALDTLMLDKTGTVTRGDWRLQDIIPFGDFTREKALALASGLEQGPRTPSRLSCCAKPANATSGRSAWRWCRPRETG